MKRTPNRPSCYRAIRAFRVVHKQKPSRWVVVAPDGQPFSIRQTFGCCCYSYPEEAKHIASIINYYIRKNENRLNRLPDKATPFKVVRVPDGFAVTTKDHKVLGMSYDPGDEKWAYHERDLMNAAFRVYRRWQHKQENLRGQRHRIGGNRR